MPHRYLSMSAALASSAVLALAFWPALNARAAEGAESGGDSELTQPAAPAAAAETMPEAEASTAATDEVQATTHVASFAATKLKDSPAVVTVVSGEDIRSTGARDLVDILNLVPGYFLG